MSIVIPILQYAATGSGYIAGTGDGVVTVNAVTASRRVYAIDAVSMTPIAECVSTQAGHYLFAHLDADKTYLILARDYKREYEPVAYDYVKPLTDLTANEQRELWRSWQT